MPKSLRSLFTALALLVLFYVGASLIATLSQLADAADRVQPGAGAAVFWILLALAATLAATPLVLYLRLPAPLKPPPNADEPRYSEYLAEVAARLRANRWLADMPTIEPTHIPDALNVLARKADEAALAAASATFVSTALMQNGRLDGLLVLATQFRLVWRIASVYYVRPTPRQALYLYSNVGAAVLISSSLEDVDFSELASPIVAGVAPALAGSVPGLGGVSRLLTNSLADGAANAFLTLRVGMLTKAYCAALVQPASSEVRRSASSAALVLLGAVTRDCGSRVAKAVVQGAAGAVGSAAGAAAQGVVVAGAKASRVARSAADAVGNAAGTAASQVRNSANSVLSGTARLGQKLAGRDEARTPPHGHVEPEPDR